MADRPVSMNDSLAEALRLPLPPHDRDSFLDPPRRSYFTADPSSPRDSYIPSTPGTNSALLLPQAAKAEADGQDPYAPVEREIQARNKSKRSLRLVLGLLIVALIVVVLAVILPVYFTVIKPKQHTKNGAAAAAGGSQGPSPTSTSGGGGPKTPQSAISGGDGSTVTTEDGSTFTYKNQFAGFWVADPNNPFNDNAQPNSWTPPLNQSWTWGKDRVFGVNLGGLFVLEPFISPALFQKYPGSTDEWSLSENMAADTASGGLNQLEDHYKTFITEQDIAEIAGAGLNWIRLPIPFWAIDKWPGEPFLERTSWKYILRVIEWARKYGLRVNLDLHTIPGSQNGFNHSGRSGQVNFLNGPMGFANAQRALNYMRILTEFFTQPQYKNVVPMFGIMNEALLSTIGMDQLTSFYLEAHNMIRGITGFGEGNGPYISIHDGFGGLSNWEHFLVGSDRIAMDTHPYFAFDGTPATDPIATGTGSGAGGAWPQRACDRWAVSLNASRNNFGVTTAGEFSNGFNDCGLFLRGVPGVTSFGGNCADWEDASRFDDATKAGLLQFAMASMDALGDFFFWTWKIGNSTAGRVESPLWSYKLGLENGWMPTDPRTSVGTCAALGISGSDFDGTYLPWQTGGAGAGTIAATSTAQFTWPPASIAGVGAATLLPSYTPTGSVVTLPPLTPNVQPTPSVDVGNGWFDAADTAGAPTPIAGCTYPDAWRAQDAAVPPLCGGGGDAGAAPETPPVAPVPLPTTAPVVPPVVPPPVVPTTTDDTGVPTTAVGAPITLPTEAPTGAVQRRA